VSPVRISMDLARSPSVKRNQDATCESFTPNPQPDTTIGVMGKTRGSSK
jgi:hypothetical protein